MILIRITKIVLDYYISLIFISTIFTAKPSPGAHPRRSFRMGAGPDPEGLRIDVLDP